jgi:hypothetical protein
MSTSLHKNEKGLPVVLGFLLAMILLGYSVYGLLHKGVNWPMKYPAPGALEWPAAVVLMLGAAMIFIHGAYFLFVLPPSAGPERPRMFFRILNWIGIFCVLGAGFVPDNAISLLVHAVAPK